MKLAIGLQRRLQIQLHLRGDDLDVRNSSLKGLDIGQGHSSSHVPEMPLFDGYTLGPHAYFLQTSDGEQPFTLTILHALNHRTHGHERRDAQHDP